ncbi:MAG: 30S ribosomal protein S7 [Parcubacteria group bacterium]|nr:30S ribosomal protein S7 [Parcubacteria group bacterium]|tara:strand:+ start:1156 stop:1635 length:480 start_codon:yes stop_codon:yes gene_type:complete
MRGKPAPKRVIDPDPKYNSTVVAKFINTIMKSGKKTTAQNVVYGAMEIIGTKEFEDKKLVPLEVFNKAMKTIGPSVETRSRRVGGANYQIPRTVRPERRQALAFRWMIEAARKKKGKTMAEKLASELIAASQGEGDAVKKKQDVQKMAESNRAFAHFAR